jgi:hypothetical protein
MENQYIYGQEFYKDGRFERGRFMFSPLSPEEERKSPTDDGLYMRTLEFNSPEEIAQHIRRVIITEHSSVRLEMPLSNIRIEKPALLPSEATYHVASSEKGKNGTERSYKVVDLSSLEKRRFWKALVGSRPPSC